MNRHSSFNREPLSPVGSQTVPASTAPANGVGTTFRCPDCDGVFSDRIRDEDSGCFYPVDDGEHYCLPCDALWTDAELTSPAPRIAQPTYEEAVAHIEKVFGLSGWALSEQAALRGRG